MPVSGILYPGLILMSALAVAPLRGEVLDRGVDRAQVMQLRQAGLILSLQEVLERAGIGTVRVIDVRLLQRQGQYLYFIAWLADDGEVREAVLNATSADFD